MQSITNEQNEYTYKSQARPLFPVEVKSRFEEMERIKVSECQFIQGVYPCFTKIITPKQLSEETRQAFELIEI